MSVVGDRRRRGHVVAGPAGAHRGRRPGSVFVKMPAETTATRLMGELGRLADTETRFYSQLSPELQACPRPTGRRSIR